jgi:hypothetical protein
MMFFWLIYIFFQSIVYMNFISENKKNYFQIIFLICTALQIIFFLLFYSNNLISVSIFIIVWLDKKIILINKFSKHNRLNVIILWN